MPWKVPRPQSSWGDPENLRWDQEAWDRPFFGSFTWTPPSVAANTTVQFTLSASGPDIVSTAADGARANASVSVTAPALLPTGLFKDALCQASDAVTILLINTTAGPLTAPAGTWSINGFVI